MGPCPRLARYLCSSMLLLAVFSYAHPARAFTRWGAWSSSYSSSFPVVHVDSCPNQYAQFFSQPWNSIANNARSAMNEWFVSGGVDFRMRWTGDLPATDSRCADAGPARTDPVDGEILLTAEQFNGNLQCFLGTTFWWNNGTQARRAKVILHAGTMCGGSYYAYPWATNADYPGN